MHVLSQVVFVLNELFYVCMYDSEFILAYLMNCNPYTINCWLKLILLAL